MCLPCIWITALLRLICIVKVVQFLFFFPGWPAGYWVCLTSTVLLLFQHTVLPIWMWKSIICPGKVASGVASSSSYSPSYISTLGSTRGGSVGILTFHTVSAVLHFWKSTICGGLGVECIQPSLEISDKLCVSSSCINSSSSVNLSGRACHTSIQTFDSSGTMLDGSSVAFHSSQHVGGCSLALSHHKICHHGCFVRQSAQGSAISAFNHLAGQRYMLCTQGFSSSVCQAVWWGHLECWQWRSTSNIGKNGQVGVFHRVCKTKLYLALK